MRAMSNTEEARKEDYRYFMVVETSNYLNRKESAQLDIFTQKFHSSIQKTIRQYQGQVLKCDNNTYVVYFTSATSSVLCAINIESKFKYVTPKFDPVGRRLKIGIVANGPGIGTYSTDLEAIEAATNICEMVKGQLVITQDVKKRYERENRYAKVDPDHIRTLKPWEWAFLKGLVNLSESNWNRPEFNVENLRRQMGLASSSLYRNVKRLTGKSPSSFIREFRLHKAIDLLHHKKASISNIARSTGFRNPSYFTKCFSDKYGILPSKYNQLHPA